MSARQQFMPIKPYWQTTAQTKVEPAKSPAMVVDVDECGRARRSATQRRSFSVPADVEYARCALEKAVEGNAIEPRYMPPKKPGS